MNTNSYTGPGVDSLVSLDVCLMSKVKQFSQRLNFSAKVSNYIIEPQNFCSRKKCPVYLRPSWPFAKLNHAVKTFVKVSRSRPFAVNVNF